MNAEGRRLFRAVVADLDDHAAKLVFADWLEESGHDPRHALAYRWAAARRLSPGKQCTGFFGWCPEDWEAPLREALWTLDDDRDREFFGGIAKAFKRLAYALDLAGVTSAGASAAASRPAGGAGTPPPGTPPRPRPAPPAAAR